MSTAVATRPTVPTALAEAIAERNLLGRIPLPMRNRKACLELMQRRAAAQRRVNELRGIPTPVSPLMG